MKFIKKNKIKIINMLFCFIVSFTILSLTSKCSFLYPFNDWVDANAFFTVGKSMMNGITPYLDIFEQKGIILYLIYGIGYLISNTTFLGIFILEIIFWTISLYFIYKIIVLYLDRRWAYLMIPLFTAFLCTSQAFTHGGSAEEFSLCFISITLFYFLDFFKTNTIGYKRIFLSGLFAGIVLLIKYTLLGFWCAFIMCIFLSFISKKEYKQALLYIFTFLGGMLLPFTLTLIYLGIKGGIKEFFNIYFVINMTAYGDVTSTLADRFKNLYQGYINTVCASGTLEYILILFMPLFLYKIEMSKSAKISTIILYLFTVLGIYWGLKFYRYYLFPIEIFELISLIGIISFIKKLIDINRFKWLIAVSIFFSITFSYFNANYSNFKFKKKEELFQYQFAEEIKKYKNPTLVNIGYLDCGVYTTTNILPTTYFFERQNIAYEKFKDNVESFKRYIKEKETMFIVYYTKLDLNKLQKVEEVLFENYNLLMEKEQEFESVTYHSYLFLRK